MGTATKLSKTFLKKLITLKEDKDNISDTKQRTDGQK